MSVVIALALSATILDGRRPLIIGAAVVATWTVSPLLGAALAVGVVARALIVRYGSRARDGDGEALLADLTVLGLSAGLTFTQAAAAAADSVGGDAASRLVRAIRFRGDGSVEEDDPVLMVVARRALSTGAPLIPAISGYAATLRSEERARHLTAARRLPVKLLFPLALLILPGFLVLTIGPAVLGSLERLGL